MKRTETLQIGDIMRQVLDETDMTQRLDQCRAADLWPSVMGPIATKTTRPYVSGTLMTVGVPNAALRHELSMSRSAIVRELNRQLGKHVIDDIRFTS